MMHCFCSFHLIAVALLSTKFAAVSTLTIVGEEEKGTIPHNMLPSLPYKPTLSTRVSSSSKTRFRHQTKNAYTSSTNSCGSCCYTIESASLYSDQLDLSFYFKVINIDGFLVTSSEATSDAALYEAALTYEKMSIDRPDLRDALISEGVHLTVIGKDEVTTDVPEYEFLGPSWNWARGLGATQWLPVTSCAEENLLCLAGDPYAAENICVHETAHTLQGSGGKLPTKRYVEIGSNEDLDDSLRRLYTSSVTNKGLWDNTYAATNHEEFWAEGVQSFYDVDTEGPVNGDGVHNSINTRKELQSYDPDLYDIISRVFPSEPSFECPPSSCDCNSFQCPNASTPAPIASTPAPIVSTPAPIVSTPAPIVSTPAPIASTPAPSPSPSQSTTRECSDSSLRFRTYSFQGAVVWRGCPWVNNKPYRCLDSNHATHCPATCGGCATCQDSTIRFKVLKDGKLIARDCGWVANRQTVIRCGYDGVAQTCPETCGLC